MRYLKCAILPVSACYNRLYSFHNLLDWLHVCLRLTGYFSGLEPHKNDNVRLVDGSSTMEGRLEVFINGSWGLVCDEAFDFRAAMCVSLIQFFFV